MTRRLINYSEAMEFIQTCIAPVAPRRIPWRDSQGTTLAEDIIAREDSPPFDNSAMDGYAVRSEDLDKVIPGKPAELRVVEEIFAGPFLPRREIHPGEAAKIMTGAPIPPGADAVVMVEETKEDDGQVSIFSSARPGQNIRARGSELKKGDSLLPAGIKIGSAEIGLLALHGIREILVRQNPRVALMTSGDELIHPEEKPLGGQVRNANTYTLSAELKAWGCPVIDLGIAKDDPAVIRGMLEKGFQEAGMMITSGGISAGEKDFLPRILQEMGVEIVFHKVAIKPGKPVLFAVWNGRYVFALPGNVVSVLTTFHLFVKPALRRLVGRDPWKNPVWYVRLATPMDNPGGRTHFVRCRLSHSPSGLPIAIPTGPQGSGMLSSLRGAEGFAVIPADVSTVAEFGILEFIPLRWD
ncbi:MAG: molybdopterin molybdotransferase MoeA [Candidatus Omnitrophica bacterium]|nr:molybdopterin molybdotransferase MoeA [Candidatus Omnitrophota bacterium]